MKVVETNIKQSKNDHQIDTFVIQMQLFYNIMSIVTDGMHKKKVPDIVCTKYV